MKAYVEQRIREHSPIVDEWLLWFNQKGEEKRERARQIKEIIANEEGRKRALYEKSRDLTVSINAYKLVILDMRSLPKSYMRDVAIAEVVKRSLFLNQQQIE